MPGKNVRISHQSTVLSLPPPNAIAVLCLDAANPSAIAERAIFDGFRDTITANADREPGARWARHASANACGWCRMLATREAVYTSAHAAGDGNRYHDHCHCMAVVVRPGQTYTPPPYVAQWDDDYKEARKISTDPAVIARLMTSPQ